MPGLILGTGKLDENLLGPVGQGTANLGGVIASASASVTNYATASASLGSVVADANAQITNFASATASLGSLTSQATAFAIISALGQSDFGSLSASADSEVENVVSASAPLGGLTVTAASVVTTFATASSSFGSLVAEANTAPTPTPTTSASAGAGMPNFVQPSFPSVQEVEKVIATATAVAMAKIPALKANAIARIDFSILADDEEVLLLI